MWPTDPAKPIGPVCSDSDLSAHRVSIEGLEIEAFISYADVAWIAHQRQDHLHGTLHVGLLSDTLKALQHIPNTVSALFICGVLCGVSLWSVNSEKLN